jgi:PilZ domain
MQTNELYDYNYVWAPHMDGWSLVGEVPEFSKDRLARLIENNSELKNAFFKREADRRNVKIPVYGHNNHLFFDGHALSVSENGALLLLNSPLLLPEQDIILHFKAEETNSTPFNVAAKIMRKNFTRTRINVKSGLHYAVRFTKFSEFAKQTLKQLVHTDTKEAAK